MISDCFNAEGGTNRSTTLCCVCLCSEFLDSRSFLCLNKKKSIYGKITCITKCGEIRQGPHCLVYIREYTDFGDKNPSVKPVVLCDAGVIMFNVYVCGSVQKVRSRFRACPRRIVIITSLKNNHMLYKQLDTTGSWVLRTHRRHFSKDLLSRFSRDFWHTRWLYAHTFCDDGHG